MFDSPEVYFCRSGILGDTVCEWVGWSRTILVHQKNQRYVMSTFSLGIRLASRHAEAALNAENMVKGDFVPGSRVHLPKMKEKSIPPSNVWHTILTVTNESCIETFRHGVHIFEKTAPRHTSGKAKRAARLDSAGLSEHIARCCLMCWLMDPSRIPSSLDKHSVDMFVQMWNNGIVGNKNPGYNQDIRSRGECRGDGYGLCRAGCLLAGKFGMAVCWQVISGWLVVGG